MHSALMSAHQHDTDHASEHISSVEPTTIIHTDQAACAVLYMTAHTGLCPIASPAAFTRRSALQVPTEYFLMCLGRHLKYSSCYYPGLDSKTPLSTAEEAMLGDCLALA